MGFEMKIIHLRFDLSCLQCVLLKKRKLEERRTREREKYETCYSFNSFILLIHCSVLPVFSNYGIFSSKTVKTGSKSHLKLLLISFGIEGQITCIRFFKAWRVRSKKPLITTIGVDLPENEPINISKIGFNSPHLQKFILIRDEPALLKTSA